MLWVLQRIRLVGLQETSKHFSSLLIEPQIRSLTRPMIKLHYLII
jgi:hypothetical protein